MEIKIKAKKATKKENEAHRKVLQEILRKHGVQGVGVTWDDSRNLDPNMPPSPYPTKPIGAPQQN